uniref:Holin n=1 Tax=Lactobacillus phage G2-Guo TaxID=3155564 RepID=A0AAU7PFX2_9VIRU
MLATGLILLTHHHYFFWPPWPAWITLIENNVVVGLIGVVTGLGMIYWAISPEKSSSLNRKLIATASAYFTLLGMTELMYAIFAPAGTPHMFMTGLSEFVMLLLTLYMAKASPTRRSSTGN